MRTYPHPLPAISGVFCFASVWIGHQCHGYSSIKRQHLSTGLGNHPPPIERFVSNFNPSPVTSDMHPCTFGLIRSQDHSGVSGLWLLGSSQSYILAGRQPSNYIVELKGFSE